jgi:hypothetical protein
VKFQEGSRGIGVLFHNVYQNFQTQTKIIIIIIIINGISIFSHCVCELVWIENIDRYYNSYTNGDVSYKHYSTLTLT